MSKVNGRRSPFLSLPVTRRQAVQSLAAGCAVAGWGAKAATLLADEAGGKKMGYVDCHSHVWTPDLEKFPLAKGATRDDLEPLSFTAEELLKLARPFGVDRVVLIQHMKFHGYDNSYMIDCARRYPGTFSIVAGVDDGAKRPEVEMRRLAKHHVRGFRITSWHDPQRWLDSPGMAAMWRCGAEEGLAMCTLIDPAALERLDQMCAQWPQTPVVIDHFARIGVDGQIRQADVERLCRMARHKQTHVKVSAFYALGKKKPPYGDMTPVIRALLAAYGPERLMWGSDCPYQLVEGQTYQDSIAVVRDRLDDLSEGDRDWLLRRTAEKVYFS